MHKLLLIFLFLSSSLLFAQDSTAVRHFDQTQLEEFANNEKYQYDKIVAVREPNAFLKGLGNVIKYIGKFIWSKNGFWFFLILLVAGILFAYRRSIFKRKAKTEIKNEYIPNILKEEGINTQDIRKTIKDAEDSGDYRAAIRNLYLLVILSLSDAKLIKLHIEKTNSDYRKELPKKFQFNFKRLTRIFDFIWYGDYPATEELFQQAKNYAKSLNQEDNVA